MYNNSFRELFMQHDYDIKQMFFYLFLINNNNN